MCFKYGQIENQRGAVAPLMAVLLIVLLLALALVVDLGHIHNAKIELQQAVDASALAGAGQLNGQSGADTRATDSAEQTLIANDVIGRAVDLASENVAITIGHWDTENLGATFEDRWAPGEEPFNAVRVQAEIEVDHIFFVFADSTTVPVDALAVQQRTELTLPLVVISCIPPTGPETGEFDACGIQTYSFASNKNTAGWSSLTLAGTGGSSQQEIADLFDGDGEAQFNRIVNLLETSPVVSRVSTWSTTFDGCEGNEGEVGNPAFCGLGGDFTGIEANADPVLRYNELPRYITTSSDEQAAFADIISLDGFLFQGSSESDAVYQNRLASLYNDPNSPFDPYGDGRFYGLGADGEQLVSYDNKSKLYIPNFNRALDYAGYPPVSATTGSMSVVMSKLLDKVTPPAKQKKDIQFTDSLTKENYPFDEAGAATSGARGETLLFTIPVIFAGSCSGFDPKSFDDGTNTAKESGELHYVGLANFLVTRIWRGGDCYETSDPVVLNVSSSLGCDPSDHEPELLNGDTYACPMKSGQPIAFEGLVRPPGLGDEPQGTRVVVYLVE